MPFGRFPAHFRPVLGLPGAQEPAQKVPIEHGSLQAKYRQNWCLLDPFRGQIWFWFRSKFCTVGFARNCLRTCLFWAFCEGKAVCKQFFDGVKCTSLPLQQKSLHTCFFAPFSLSRRGLDWAENSLRKPLLGHKTFSDNDICALHLLPNDFSEKHRNSLGRFFFMCLFRP